jgi:DNA polymerase V
VIDVPPALDASCVRMSDADLTRAAPRLPARRTFPIQPERAGEEAVEGGDCSAAESFALRVIGGSMAPEFLEGDIVIIEPQGLAREGSYVLLQLPGSGWVLRQLGRQLRPEGGADWVLRVLDGSEPAWVIPGPQVLRGVVIQRSRRGRPRQVKWYG